MADVVLPFAQVWGVTILLAGLFGCAGMGFYRIAFVRREAENPFYLWGLSYFLGMFLFLVLLRLGGVLFGSARLACWGAVLLMLVTAGWSVWQGLPHGAGVLMRRVLPAVLLLVGLYTLIMFAFWLEATLEINAWTGYGSGHSGRYANIGIVAVEQDTIPRLGQNYGQSLLVATHIFLGVRAPLASLTAWLVVSHAMLAIFLFGFFRQLIGTNGLAGVATFLFLFCNISLSLSHVLVLANGSPIFYMPYTDMVASVATCILFVLWLHDVLHREMVSWNQLVLVPLLFGIVWNWCAPENIVTCSILCAVLFALALLFPARLPWSRVFGVGATLAAAILLGATQGGMLMPANWAHPFDIPGVESYARDAVKGMGWDPGLEFFYRFGFDGGMGRDAYPKDDRIASFQVESIIWMALRIVFFPLLGIVGLACQGANRPTPSGTGHVERFGFWALCAAVVFAVSFLIEFSFSYVNPMTGLKWDTKWDLARLLISGVALGLVCLVFWVHRAISGLPQAWLRFVAWAGVVGVATFGPMHGVWTYSKYSYWDTFDSVPFGQRLHVLFNTRDVLPQTFLERHLLALKSADAPTRREAVVKLAVLNGYAPEIYLREALTTALIERGHRELVEALEDEDAEVRRLAAQTMIQVHSAASPRVLAILIEALQGDTAQGRREAAQHLANLGPEASAAVPALLQMIRKADEPARFVAAHAVVQIQGTETAAVVPLLAEALTKEEPALQQGYLWALARFGPAAAEAVPALVGLLDSEDVATRRATACVLVEIQGAEAGKALPILVEALTETDAALCNLYATYLARFGPAASEAVQPLTDLLLHENEDLRRTAACTLVQIQGGQARAAFPTLLAGLRDARPEVRDQCAAAFAQLGPEAASVLDMLTGALRETESFREAAEAALKKIQPK